MRILIISFYFPPYNSIGAVRIGKIAKHLSRFGHDVRVLSARDQPLPQSLRLEIPECAVSYTNWLNVNRLAELVVGGRTRVAARGYVLSGIRQTGLRRFVESLAAAYKAFLNFPDGEIGWLPHAHAEGVRIGRRWRPDIIYASARPYTGHIVAASLSRILGIPWVAELRDLWVDNQNYPYGRTRRGLEQKLEKYIYSNVAGFITVSEPLAAILRRKYDKPVTVVTNGYDPSDYSEDWRASSGGRLELLYTGTIYPGKQDPRPLFRAIRQLGEGPERLRVRFFGRYLGCVMDWARDEGVAQYVEVHEPVPFAESVRLQRTADLLVLLLWNDLSERGVFTGKLFEYLGARRPILGVGPDGCVASALIKTRQAGAVLHTPDQIAQYLKRMLRRKWAEGHIPDLPVSTAAGLTREDQTRELEKFLLTAQVGSR